ncbi:8474_t:CDS:2 [Diversispora eburnea]|uniref:8474_t:CDS:1 n=1 Tax=Diversispora eburnea TaxID=1213867 RepID=A0A9N9AAY2_9GLOM|nr:8474_t:CDS:2 [Diversispora eburnea]
MSSKKRNYRRKLISSDDDDISKNGDEKDVSEALEEIIELRKFRRRPLGIDAEKLSKGESKTKKKKKDEDPWKLTTGGIVVLNSTEDEERCEVTQILGYNIYKENAGEKKIMLDSFTKQTNALDVDKHMMAYIEEEMRNVQLSTTMLTAIPEVDLGIDVRLKNIEKTEIAKRKLLEQRHTKPKEEKDVFEGSNFAATNRCKFILYQ